MLAPVRPLTPALARPFFLAQPTLRRLLARGDVAGVVRQLRVNPALALAVAGEVRRLLALPDAELRAAEPTLRVLVAACTLYAHPSPAVSP